VTTSFPRDVTSTISAVATTPSSTIAIRYALPLASTVNHAVTSVLGVGDSCGTGMPDP
jgi:hypothetical protein